MENNIFKDMKKLFLDDERSPMDTFGYTGDGMYTYPNWDVVKSYNEFVEYIKANGVPKLISFDHDLADIHYKTFLTPQTLDGRQKAWDDYHENEKREKTGHDCLKWLLDYCHDNDVVLPKIYIHTMNNVGYQNMMYYLNGAIKNKFVKLA